MPWPTGRKFYFSGADITDADGTTKTTITDQSGNGNDLVVGGSGAVVTVRANAWNGKRALELSSHATLALTLALNRRDMTVLMVVKSASPMCHAATGFTQIYRGLWFDLGGTDNPSVGTNSDNFDSLTIFDGSGGRNAGQFAPDYDAVMWRCGSANVTTTSMSGDATSLPLANSTMSGIAFGDKPGGGEYFQGQKLIALIAVWDYELSDAERDAAMAMALADYPRVGSTWNRSQTQLVGAGTSVHAGYLAATEANTIGRLLEASIPQTTNVAVSGSFTSSWAAWAPYRIDPFLSGAGTKILLQDAPRNDVTAGESDPSAALDAWFDYFEARRGAIPGLIVVGTTMLPLGGNSTGSNNFNDQLLDPAHYEAFPDGGANTWKLKSDSSWQGRAPDYVADVASVASVTSNLGDGTHPTNAGIQGQYDLYSPLLLAISGSSSGGGGGGGGLTDEQATMLQAIYDRVILSLPDAESGATDGLPVLSSNGRVPAQVKGMDAGTVDASALAGDAAAEVASAVIGTTPPEAFFTNAPSGGGSVSISTPLAAYVNGLSAPASPCGCKRSKCGCSGSSGSSEITIYYGDTRSYMLELWGVNSARFPFPSGATVEMWNDTEKSGDVTLDFTDTARMYSNISITPEVWEDIPSYGGVFTLRVFGGDGNRVAVVPLTVKPVSEI